MPTFVYTDKCDGCEGREVPACMEICPHDLMALDPVRKKAVNQEPEQCWECFNCVKICPQQAVEVRGYSDFVPLGSQTIPLRGTDTIMWTITFRSGLTKRFKFPIRTTVEGTVDPFAGKPEPDFSTIKGPGLFNKPARTE